MQILWLASKYWKKYRNFFLYSVIGVTGVLLDTVIFYSLTNLMNINHQIANVISTTAGIANNFTWNVIFNFKTKDKLLVRFVNFYAVGLSGLLLTTSVLFIFVDIAKFPAIVVKICSLVVVLILQYSLNKGTSFKKSTEQ